MVSAYIVHHVGLGGHAFVPCLIRRSSLNVQSSLFVHTGKLGTGIDIVRLDSLNLEFSYTKLIVGNPDNGLWLPHGGVVESTLVESGSVAVRGTGVSLFVGNGHPIVVELAFARAGSSLGCRQTGLVGHLTELAVLDRVGRVSKVEIVRSESEPVNVDLECGSEDDLGDLRIISLVARLRGKIDSP